MNSDGTIANGMKINTTGNIKAGSIAAPSTSEVTITLNSNTSSTKLDCLKLAMKANCPREYQGIALNTRQGIEIRNLSISLPEGVEVNLEDILESESEE